MKTMICVLCAFWCGIGCLAAQRRPVASKNNQVKEGEYVIQGKIGGNYTGKVYLSQWEGDRYVDLDSAEVTNGTFTIQREAPEVVELAYLRNNERKSELSLFLEEGLIRANLPGKNFSWGGQVSGTLNNAVLAKYKRDSQYTMDSIIMEAGIEELQRTDTVYDREGAMRRSALITQRGIDQARQLVKRFSNLPVAAYLIERYLAPNITPEEVEVAVNSLDPVLANHPFVLKIRKDLRSKLLRVGDEALEFPEMKEGVKPLRLADYKGKYLLVDFWASWCGPCLKEMPEMVKLYKAYKGKKFDMIGISLDQEQSACDAVVKKMGMKWRQVCDLNVWDGEFARLYNVKTIPYTVLIGPDSKVIAIGLRGQELVNKVKELVK